MHSVASSTVDILMKPNPRERSDCWERLDRHGAKSGSQTDPLIVNNGNLFNPTKTTKFLIKITFLSTNTQSKHAKDVGRIRRLLEIISIKNFFLIKRWIKRTNNWSLSGTPGWRRATTVRRWASKGTTIAVGTITISAGRRATRTRIACRCRVSFSRSWCRKRIVRVGIRVDGGCSVVSVLQEGRGRQWQHKRWQTLDSPCDGSTKGIVGPCLRSSHVPKPSAHRFVCAIRCFHRSSRRYRGISWACINSHLYKYARERAQRKSNSRRRVKI